MILCFYLFIIGPMSSKNDPWHAMTPARLLLMCLFQTMVIPTIQAAPCGNHPAAEQLADLIRTHENQQRPELTCNTTLNQIAQIKANHVIESQNIWHHAGRMSPNQLLRHHGFKLPKTYPLFGNQVEALAGGEAAADAVLDDFLNSEPHRQLLLGEDPFFLAQDQIGVAFIEAPDTDHRYYWVVIIADERNHTIRQNPVIDVDPPVISKKKSRGREIKEKMSRRKVRSRWRWLTDLHHIWITQLV